MIIASIAKKADGISVAGLRVDGRGWIRFVSQSRTGILYPGQILMQSGSRPRLLDRCLVDAPCADQILAQPENYILSGQSWRLLERPANREALKVVADAADRRTTLFGTREPRISASRAGIAPPEESIVLVRLASATFAVMDDDRFARRKTRMLFEHGGRLWDLPLIDSLYRRVLSTFDAGEYDASVLSLRSDRELYAVITLSEPFHDWCYKSVSSLFQLPFAREQLRTPAAPRRKLCSA